ncbi:hypothetical protein ACXJY6_11750 [Vibrio sp. RC27]
MRTSKNRPSSGDVNDSDTSQEEAQERLFLALKTKILNEYEFYEANEMANRLFDNDANCYDSFQKLECSGQVLYVETETTSLYPTFQLDSNNFIYSTLLATLPRMYEKMTGWDVVFWLTNPTTVTIVHYEYSNNEVQDIINKELSLNQLAEYIVDNETPDGTITAKPIDLLRHGDSKLFQCFVDDLLNRDTRKIPIVNLLD